LLNIRIFNTWGGSNSTPNPRVFVYGARADEVPLKAPIVKNKIKLVGKRNERRVMFRRLPWGFLRGFVPICCDTSDPYSVLCGYLKRLFRIVLKPDPEFAHRFAAFVTQWCKENLTPCDSVFDYYQWRSTLRFSQSRLAQYDAAFNALRGGLPTKRQCSHIDTFPKTERYDDFKFMRMINSRCDAFKVYSGPIFKSIESVIYALPQFVKHLFLKNVLIVFYLFVLTMFIIMLLISPRMNLISLLN